CAHSAKLARGVEKMGARQQRFVQDPLGFLLVRMHGGGLSLDAGVQGAAIGVEQSTYFLLSSRFDQASVETGGRGGRRAPAPPQPGGCLLLAEPAFFPA